MIKQKNNMVALIKIAEFLILCAIFYGIIKFINYKFNKKRK